MSHPMYNDTDICSNRGEELDPLAKCNCKMEKEYFTTVDLPEEKYLTKEEFDNGEQGIVGWNINKDELHFACGTKVKVNRNKSPMPPK